MKLLACFPGCGKSTLAANHPEVNDSDFSRFDKTEFPSNYLQHLQEKYAAGEPTLISTHREVREGLRAAGIPFVLVYPDKADKAIYRKRYIDRLTTDGTLTPEEAERMPFVKLLDENWDQWIDECYYQLGCYHIRMGGDEFLSDVVRVENGEFVLNNPVRLQQF